MKIKEQLHCVGSLEAVNNVQQKIILNISFAWYVTVQKPERTNIGLFAICHFQDDVIYYNYQNPPFCCFPFHIRDVIFPSVGLQNINLKMENKDGPGSCSKITSL